MAKVCLVTGASRGIGRGIALALSSIGCDLVINYQSNQAGAEATRNDCLEAAAENGFSPGIVICQADIAEATDRARLLEVTREKFGRLDLLVNNAGVAPNVRADLLETSEESFDRVMKINLKGPFFLTQAAAKWMLEQSQSEGSARAFRAIVTISSISAYTASINRGEYCMAKAALSMLTPLFATRLADDGILVYEIRPGIIATDMTAPVQEKYDKLIAEGLTPMKRWGNPHDIARAVVAITQGYLPFSTGEVINVDGGFHLRRL